MIDLSNKKFGRVRVLYRDGTHIFPSGQKRPLWLCECECGKRFKTFAQNLMSGNTKSCGCLRSELNTSHDKWGTKIYKCWDNMRNRCLNPKATGFKYWGGRGISIYPKWVHSFDAFYDYVSKLEHFGEVGYTLDRIDNNGNYEPNNLRWATRSQQNKNKRH